MILKVHLFNCFCTNNQIYYIALYRVNELTIIVIGVCKNIFEKS